MGAYLSEPVTEKISKDVQNEFLACGASSMQGWRLNQEDSHNCMPNFDRDRSISFFGVYDGHGGAEIAQFCSQRFPAYLKTLDPYKAGEFEKALKDAFMGFDELLLDEEILELLKTMAGDKYPAEDMHSGSESEDEEDIAELCQESQMPLTEVLEKYKGPMERLKEKQKPLSPFLRAQKGGDATAASSSAAGAAASTLTTDSTASGSSSAAGPSGSGGPSAGPSGSRLARKLDADIDSTVSSSSTSEKKAEAARESNEVVSECETPVNSKESYNSPDSSSSSSTVRKGADVQEPEKPGSSTDQVAARQPEVKVPNGGEGENAVSASSSNVPGGSHQEAEVSTNSGKCEGVSSSSSAVQENGEVTSNSGGCSSSNEVPAKKTATPKDVVTPNLPASSSDEDESYNETSTEDLDEEDSDVDDEEEYEEDSDEERANADPENYVNAEDEAFMSNMVEEPGKDSGCTAVVALLCGKDLYVANAGDSRCVVCRDGKAIEMSFDHKPEDEIEHKRITLAGGRVTVDGRVNGGLNLSRAIGDHAYKMNTDLPPDQQMISAMPDIKKLAITPEDEFMVLACDGIWNFMSSENVVQFVKKRLDEGRERISQICEELFDHCLAKDTTGDGTGCDNMTAIIVKFTKELPQMMEVEQPGGELVASSKKRSASPAADEVVDGKVDGPKRLKTDEEFSGAVIVDTIANDVSST